MVFAGKPAGEIVWHSVGRLSAGKLAGSDMGEIFEPSLLCVRAFRA